MSDTTPITDAMLAAWRATTEAATPGPWFTYFADVGPTVQVPSGSLASLPYSYCGGKLSQMDNAKFIAAAREAMPLLIAEVERLRAENKDLSEAFDEVVAEANVHVQVAREGRDTAHATATERVQSEMARLRAELAASPAWHDAPTGPGLWYTGRGHCPSHVIPEHDWNNRETFGRWVMDIGPCFGPIPQMPASSPPQ